jgi:hypothetical protein
VPCPTERHFISELPPSVKDAKGRDGMLFVRSAERERPLFTGVMHVTLDSAWNVFSTTTQCSISKAIKYLLFLHNFYKFTVLNVILKYGGVDILLF